MLKTLPLIHVFSKRFMVTSHQAEIYRVGDHPLVEWPSSHTTVHTVRHTAVQRLKHNNML